MKQYPNTFITNTFNFNYISIILTHILYSYLLITSHKYFTFSYDHTIKYFENNINIFNIFKLIFTHNIIHFTLLFIMLVWHPPD